MKHKTVILGGSVGIILTASVLSWVASGFNGFTSWTTFLGFSLIGALILLVGFWLISTQEAQPAWLPRLVIAAALLRLGIGVIWFTTLPYYGYGSPSEIAGYVMSDAYKRDQAAWRLASSGAPLLDAYGKYSKADQYGGMLLLSAALYRGLNGQIHTPLGMVVVTATFSALAVGFVWAFARRAWGEKIAVIAAWGMALYPEAVLQGSTQMREAFLMTLVMVVFYGLALFHQRDQQRKLSFVGAAWMVGGLILSLFLSPPAAGLLLISLLLVALIWGGFISRESSHKPLFWLVLGVLALVILVGSFFALERLTGQSFSNPLELFAWWFRKTAAFQAYLTERASGWVQTIFRTTPDWLHTPLLLAYGAIQPFLPAAIADFEGVLVWRILALWRSLGWALLLPLLIYASIRAWRHPKIDRLATALCLVTWLIIFLAAFRGGADPWDNVRYRAADTGLQITLASWAWIGYQRSKDPWFRRAVLLAAMILAWSFPWYIDRYTAFTWAVKDPFKILGLGLSTAALFILLDWLKTLWIDQNKL